MRYYFFLTSIVLMLTGCSAGHQDWIDWTNDRVGKKQISLEVYKPKNAGKLFRGDCAIVGQGITHITKNKNNDLIIHWSDQEILANSRCDDKWVGKCLFYLVVDSKTHIIKSWGFEKGANPLSCRTWP